MESSREIPELQNENVDVETSPITEEESASSQIVSVVEQNPKTTLDQYIEEGTKKIENFMDGLLKNPVKSDQKQDNNISEDKDEQEQEQENKTHHEIVPIQEETPAPQKVDNSPSKKRSEIQIRKVVAPLVELARGEMVNLWTPAPIPQPAVDRELLQMPALERVTEIWRYSLLSGEYALSSNGLLREWFKLVLKVALLLMIPVFIFVPIITIFMANSSSISGYLVDITGNILWSFIHLLLLALVVCFAGVLFVVFPKVLRWINSR